MHYLKRKIHLLILTKKLILKKRELETRRRLVEVERSIISEAPLILVAPHRSYIKEGLLKFTYKNDTITGIVYILNDCLVLTKTVTKTKDKLVNMLFNMANTNSIIENHYLETILFKDLELIEVNSVQFAVQHNKQRWEFNFDTEDSKREWYTSFKEAIDAYALHILFEEGMYKPEKPLQILHASYGKLKTTEKTTTDKNSEPEQVEVTNILQKIMQQQGGHQLILNSGSKAKLFGFGTKKIKTKQLRIVCSIKGSVKVFLYQDTEPVLLNEDTI